jgi:hypothetical protein
MAENWFQLSPGDQAEALEVAAGQTGRPAHLLEKDIWVVWTLDTLFRSSLGSELTFKGGTSLSKAYRLIERFSEDVDLTCDIRMLVPDLLRDGNPIPPTASQEKKISAAVRARLPAWIKDKVVPVLQGGLQQAHLGAELATAGEGGDKLLLTYPALKTGTGYAAANVLLEFGARATGEPNQLQPVQCDLARVIKDIDLPSALPRVMKAERTFWEKATAAHVFCLQGRLRGERYSRHWHDLAAYKESPLLMNAVQDRSLALQVAEHKSMFFSEKDADGQKIDYFCAASGALRLIPQGASRNALASDYRAMLEDGLLPPGQPEFDVLLEVCAAIESLANQPVEHASL